MERKCKYCDDNIDQKKDTAKFCTRGCKEQYRCMVTRQNTESTQMNEILAKVPLKIYGLNLPNILYCLVYIYKFYKYDIIL